MSKAYISVNFSGYLALTDFVKIAHLIEVQEDAYPLQKSAEVASKEYVASFKSDPVEAVVAAGDTVYLQGEETVETTPAPVDTGSPEVDAHGHAWSELLHAATKGTTKDGLWRMKVGVTRPAPMPGFPKDTGTTTTGEDTQPEASVVSPAVTEAAPVQTDTAEDDEFAAFRNAAADADATAAAAKASVPARKWTDADLGALCNQAAVKLGDPVPVKEIIGQFVPEGTVAHSRNIPEESREDFAKAVEAKAGIEFAG